MARKQQIAVIGAGQMGGGIAQVFAAAGNDTQLYDERGDAVKHALAQISKLLDRGIEKGVITADDKTGTLARITPVDSLQDLAAADIVIEAIVENTVVKQDLFASLDTICRPEAILASNTSSISITKIAAATSRPERVIGLHFMNPVPVMKLVEIIRGLQTSDETYTQAKAAIEGLGKTAVTARRDYPGFIVNRILVPMINEAFFVLMEGIATPEEIDEAMKLGTNQPMGPLALADFVGLDTCLAICRIFHNELGDDKYRPCPLMIKYVEAGWFGKKVGRGVYQY
jgi:3-hydroxybutyryl-CoA dehydrogenase